MTEMQIGIFKSTWTGLTERFDQAAIEKYKEQASSDSDTWIQKRLLKSMEGQPIDKNFLGLFQYQLQILYQLYFYTKEINHALSEKEKKIISVEQASLKTSLDLKETQNQLKRSSEKVLEA